MPQPTQSCCPVAVAATGAGSEPCSQSSQQRRGAGHEGENGGAPSRPGDVLSRTRNYIVDATARVRLGETGAGRHKAYQVTAVFRRHAAMTRGREKEPAGFGTRVGQVALLRTFCAEQPIEIIG